MKGNLHRVVRHYGWKYEELKKKLGIPEGEEVEEITESGDVVFIGTSEQLIKLEDL